MVESSDLAQVMAEAQDIARSVDQQATTAHVLLALFTVENRAARLLAERNIDEDRLLALLTGAPKEPDGLLRELRSKSQEIAASCNCAETECLHALIAMTRVRCSAQDLLLKTALDLTGLRNTALGYFASGRMPRRLARQSSARSEAGRPLGAAPLPRVPKVRAQVRLDATEPPVSVKDLVDTQSEVAEDSQSLEREGTLPNSQGNTPEEFSTFSQGGLDARSFPLLAALGRNLSWLAREGKLDPVVGRAKEIDELIDILGKRRTNNPILLGEPGVGKTAIVEGVAQQLLFCAPASQRQIIEIDVASLVAGTQLRGSFSERLMALKEEVRKARGSVVVFIDEIHTLMGAGSTGDGPQDAANELKAAMSRGEFPCIGATTQSEYGQHVATDAALERRFTPVLIQEPTVADTVYIINGVIGRYAQHHQLQYAPEAIAAAASLSAKYIKDRFLPDKAISILDHAGSRCRREGKATVEAEDVARVVAKIASLPEERLLIDDAQRLLTLEQQLAGKIVGHEHVIARVSRVIRRNYAGFASRRPMGSFLFLGPTGVGKTELARALSEVVFGSSDALIRIDMSEMSEGHSVSRMVGAPAGYVGYGEGGLLTEEVRRRPASVVVLDEIEKAHPDVLMLLLQILEEGQLTDGRGRKVNFASSVVILTTNLGSDTLTRSTRAVGFGQYERDAKSAEAEASAAVRKLLPPELWNRIDEHCAFQPLTLAQVSEIANRLLSESSRRLMEERGIRFEASQELVAHLVAEGGFDTALGARPMRRAIQKVVEGPLSEGILSGAITEGDSLYLAVADGALRWSAVRAA